MSVAACPLRGCVLDGTLLLQIGLGPSILQIHCGARNEANETG